MPFTPARPARIAACALAALLALDAAPAHAQLRGMIGRKIGGAIADKATDKATEKATDRIDDKTVTLLPPTFDKTTVEITPARLDAFVAALGEIRATRAQKRKELEPMWKERDALYAQADKAFSDRDREAFDRVNRSYDECASGVRDKVQDQNNARAEARAREMQAKAVADPRSVMNDPMLKEQMAYAQLMAQAQSRNDQAEVARLQKEMEAKTMARMKAMGFADSTAAEAATVKACGPRPAKPAGLVRQEQLQAQGKALGERIDRIQKEADGQVPGSRLGLTDTQAAMLAERIEAFLSGSRSHPITRTFTKGEWDLLAGRRDELRKALHQG